jgi:hypothetical protein
LEGLPTGVTEIGERAFEGCTGLTEKIVVYDGIRSFHGDTSITRFIVAEGVTTIGIKAFYGCTGLTSLEGLRSTGVTEIGEMAFYGCTGLTSLEGLRSTGVTTIGNGAFQGCTGLTSLVGLPPDLTPPQNTFSACKPLSVMQGLEESQNPSPDFFKKQFSEYSNHFKLMSSHLTIEGLKNVLQSLRDEVLSRQESASIPPFTPLHFLCANRNQDLLKQAVPLLIRIDQSWTSKKEVARLYTPLHFAR